MKTTLIVLAIIWSSNVFGQTYYNPRNSLDINITIKEPYKPVDYYEISNNLSRGIKSEAERRDQLKKYYDQILFETKNTIQSISLLTGDYEIDQLIFKLNETTFGYLDKQNTLLKRGLLKPNEYEFKIKNIYYKHINSNKILVSIFKYKYQKETSASDENEIINFRNNFTSSINQIQGFIIDSRDDYQFLISKDYNKQTSIIKILDFIQSNTKI